MVEIELRSGETVEWIVDNKLGHWLWNKIESSPRVRFTEGVSILVKLVQIGEDDNLVRLAGDEPDDDDSWASPFSLISPEMRMGTSFEFQLRDKNPREIRMAVYARTNNGANFTHEFFQEKEENAEGLMRVPVPNELRDEAEAIADRFPKCEMIRTQTGAFNERFNITDEDAPVGYWEPHIKCRDITDQGELMEVFDEVLDMVERGVRTA